MDREKKQFAAGCLVVLVVGVALGWPWLTALRMKWDTREALDDLGRYPEPAQILEVEGVLFEAAEANGLDPGGVGVFVRLEERAAKGLVEFKFVVVDVEWGSLWGEMRIREEKKIENELNDAFLDPLEGGDVELQLLEED